MQSHIHNYNQNIFAKSFAKKINFAKLLIIFALVLYYPICAQNGEFEIEYQKILSIRIPQQKIDSLEKFSKFVAFKDYKFGEKASLKLIELTRNTTSKKQFLTAYNVLGLVTHYLGENEKALLIFDTLIKKSIGYNDTLMEAKAHGNLGLVYEGLGNFKKAYSEYSKSLKLAERVKNKSMMAASYGNMGNVLVRLNDFKGSIPNFEKAAELFIETENIKATANQYNSLSQAYNGLNNIKTQELYLEKAAKLYRDIGEKRALGTVLLNLGGIQEDFYHNSKEAINITNEALALKIETDDLAGIANAYLNLSGQYASVKSFDKSFEAIKKAKTISEKLNDLFFISNVLEKFSMLYRLKGDFKNAYNYHIQFTTLKDSIVGKETQKSIVEFKELYESEKKQSQIDNLEKRQAIAKLEIIKNEEQLKREKAQRVLIVGVLIFVIVLCVFLIRAFIIKRNNAQLLETKNELINAKNAALQTANKESLYQKHIIEEKQKEIVDSINYAKRIQVALLANHEFVNQFIPNNFILFKPKDIVSGDFYWATEHNNKFYIAVCDCTGHGVPGAFMSLLNIGFLSEAIKEKGIEEPHEIFNYVRSRLIDTISKDGQQDGMDGILLCLDKATNQYTYAAANNEPILISNNEVKELPKDKMPVGKGEKTQSFALHTIKANKGDTLFLYTDGYADQFGGAKGKKFKYKALNDLLLANVNQSMVYQKEHLNNTIEQWRGNLEQVDDILVIGIKL